MSGVSFGEACVSVHCASVTVRARCCDRPSDRHNRPCKDEDHVADAVRKRGQIRCGGSGIGKSGTFFEPTVITAVETTMQVAQEETFGPLAPIIRFNDPDQVVREANDTIYGLAAYFYASNLKRVWRVAEALEFAWWASIRDACPPTPHPLAE